MLLRRPCCWTSCKSCHLPSCAPILRTITYQTMHWAPWDWLWHRIWHVPFLKTPESGTVNTSLLVDGHHAPLLPLGPFKLSDLITWEKIGIGSVLLCYRCIVHCTFSLVLAMADAHRCTLIEKKKVLAQHVVALTYFLMRTIFCDKKRNKMICRVDRCSIRELGPFSIFHQGPFSERSLRWLEPDTIRPNGDDRRSLALHARINAHPWFRQAPVSIRVQNLVCTLVQSRVQGACLNQFTNRGTSKLSRYVQKLFVLFSK